MTATDERRHSLPEVVRRRLADSDLDLIDPDFYDRRGIHFVDVRRAPCEVRVNDDGTVHFTGYATTWDTWYDVAGGPPYGWSESIARGAASRSLAENADVRFLFDHEGIPMARTKSKTMTLEADDVGLLSDVPSADVQRNVFAQALHSAIDRGDVDEMSFAFKVIRQEWNGDYTERRILELRLFDVSAVSFPANPATIIGVRNQPPEVETKGGMPLSLARALAESLN